MDLKIENVNAVVEKLNSYFDIDVEIDHSLFTVHAESSKAINEFESRLVAAATDWEDEENELANLNIFLNDMVDFVDHREKFEPLVRSNPDGTWVARYTHIVFTDEA